MERLRLDLDLVIEALGKLAPPTAEVRRNGEIREIPVEELLIGDTVIVRPNVRLPADGFVVSGVSSVNQAPVTGESMPVDKRSVDDRARAAAKPDTVESDRRVYAGTINGGGASRLRLLDLQPTPRSLASSGW